MRKGEDILHPNEVGKIASRITIAESKPVTTIENGIRTTTYVNTGSAYDVIRYEDGREGITKTYKLKGDKTMNENYTYAAILDFDEEGFINIEFPMFEGAVTSVKQTGNPISAAQEILALAIKDYKDEHRELPDEGFVPEIGINQRVVFINLNIPYDTPEIKEVYTRKTVTLPLWLEQIAKANKINFSATLVKGLKEELNLS